MNIIGISGQAGSGKDTVADMLLEHEGFTKVSLADPIKRFAKEMWGFTDEQLWGGSEHRNEPDARYGGLTPRKVLQHLGTEGGRALDYDVWIRYAVNTARTLLDNSGSKAYSPKRGVHRLMFHTVNAVVIPDVRFINEVQHLRKEGGKLLRVIRPGAGLEGEFAQHESEIQMSKISDNEFDYVILNTGTLEDLRRKVDQFIDQHLVS